MSEGDKLKLKENKKHYRQNISKTKQMNNVFLSNIGKMILIILLLLMMVMILWKVHPLDLDK